MTLDEATFAGFMKGTDIALAILENVLREVQPVELPQILKLVQNEVAGEVANRMEDVGLEPTV